jgi:hypothetical protein
MVNGSSANCRGLSNVDEHCRLSHMGAEEELDIEKGSKAEANNRS